MKYYSKHIFICTNQKNDGKQCCANSGGLPFFEYLKMRLKDLGIHGPGQIRVSKSGCLGRCSLGPTLVIYPEGVWYTYRTTSDLEDIINQHLLAGKIVQALLIDPCGA